MSNILALIAAPLLAASGIAVMTTGPDCTAKKDCPLGSQKVAACCDDGSCDHCQEMTSESNAHAYDSAMWPSHNKDLYAKDFQGQALPVALGKETWLSDTVDTAGKVVVLDFWATWCPPCRAASPILDELQQENKDTLAVLALSGQREELSKVEAYVTEHSVSYAHLFDADQSVYAPFESKGIPLVVVISTDGIIRWIGNPHEEGFLPAVNQTIAADPLVQAQPAAQSITHNDG